MKTLLRLAPLAAITATAAGLQTHWDDLPDRWPVHWGWRGEPNGWVERTPGGVFFPLVLALVLWGVMEGVATVSYRRSQLPTEVRQAAAGLVRLISLAVISMLCMMAVWLPFSQGSGPSGVIRMSLLLLLASVVGGGVQLSGALRRAHMRGSPGLEGYSAFGYRKVDDSRIWVPKLSGLGYTLNFARWQSWLILAALISPALLALGFVLFR